ncbi:hypothetical protein IG631_13720 [Alternaria alternata]|nr:hypothetical protein IG631_13720 [Alternaria alternata]
MSLQVPTRYHVEPLSAPPWLVRTDAWRTSQPMAATLPLTTSREPCRNRIKGWQLKTAPPAQSLDFFFPLLSVAVSPWPKQEHGQTRKRSRTMTSAP